MRRLRVGSVAVLAAALVAAVPGAAPLTANAATAYTVEPLNYNLTETTPRLFNGAVCVIYDCVKVPTAAALDPSHRDGVFGEDGPISAGAAALDDKLILDDDDEKLVFGYSQGAQVAGFWLRNYAPATAVDRDSTSFLLVGDPENTYGVPWAPKVPTDSGFAVTEVWAQYDGWADWPARFDLLAAANAVYGMLFVHPVAYDDMDLAAERAAGNVVSWQNGGITYEMVLTRKLPLLDPLRNIGLGWVADRVNDDWREHIEAQYDRPSTQEEADATYGAEPEPEPEVERFEPAPVDAGAETTDPQPAKTTSRRMSREIEAADEDQTEEDQTEDQTEEAPVEEAGDNDIEGDIEGDIEDEPREDEPREDEAGNDHNDAVDTSKDETDSSDTADANEGTR